MPPFINFGVLFFLFIFRANPWPWVPPPAHFPTFERFFVAPPGGWWGGWDEKSPDPVGPWRGWDAPKCCFLKRFFERCGVGTQEIPSWARPPPVGRFLPILIWAYKAMALWPGKILFPDGPLVNDRLKSTFKAFLVYCCFRSGYLCPLLKGFGPPSHGFFLLSGASAVLFPRPPALQTPFFFLKPSP